MKIFTISGTFDGGGPGAVVKQVHEALLKQKEQSVVCNALTPFRDKDIHWIYGKIGFLIRCVCLKFHLPMRWLSKAAAGKTIRILKKEAPDLIHVHVIHHGCYDYEKLFRFLAEYGKPVICSLHDCWLMTGGCYHFADVACRGYLEGCSHCPKKRAVMDCAPEKTHVNLESKKLLLPQLPYLQLVGVSEWTQEILKGSYLEQFPCTVIHNAVDLDVFYPRAVTKYEVLHTDRHAIVGVANAWSEAKGLPDFIRLAQLLGNNYQIFLVGDMSQNTALPDNVTSLGKISSRDRLAEVYSAADVFVHLSRLETFGMVLAEAACCGKLVIGYNSTAIPSVVKVAGGYTAPAGDVKQVGEYVRMVCENSMKLDAETLCEVRQAFSDRTMVDRYIELYENTYGKTKDR